MLLIITAMQGEPANTGIKFLGITAAQRVSEQTEALREIEPAGALRDIEHVEFLGQIKVFGHYGCRQGKCSSTPDFKDARFLILSGVFLVYILVVSAYMLWLAGRWNQLMHTLNGNMRGSSFVPAAVRQRAGSALWNAPQEEGKYSQELRGPTYEELLKQVEDLRLQLADPAQAALVVFQNAVLTASSRHADNVERIVNSMVLEGAENVFMTLSDENSEYVSAMALARNKLQHAMNGNWDYEPTILEIRVEFQRQNGSTHWNTKGFCKGALLQTRWEEFDLYYKQGVIDYLKDKRAGRREDSPDPWGWEASEESVSESKDEPQEITEDKEEIPLPAPHQPEAMEEEILVDPLPQPVPTEIECPICRDGIVDMTTLCGHQFHQSCLDIWLNRNVSCPMCRAELRDPLEWIQQEDAPPEGIAEDPPTPIFINGVSLDGADVLTNVPEIEQFPEIGKEEEEPSGFPVQAPDDWDPLALTTEESQRLRRFLGPYAAEDIPDLNRVQRGVVINSHALHRGVKWSFIEYDSHIHIRAMAEYGRGANIQVKPMFGLFEKWDGYARVDMADNKAVFLHLANGEANNFVPGQGASNAYLGPVGDNVDRCWDAIRTYMPLIGYKVDADLNNLVMKAKAHYNRFYDQWYGLQDTLNKIVISSVFRGVYQRYATHLLVHEVHMIRIQVQLGMSKTLLDFEKEWLDGHNIFPFRAITSRLGWWDALTYFSMIFLDVDKDNWSGDTQFDLELRAARAWLLNWREKIAPKDKQPVTRKMKNLWIRRIRTDGQEIRALNPPQGVRIEYRENPLGEWDGEEKKVQVIGSTVNVPVAIPELSSQNLDFALRKRQPNIGEAKRAEQRSFVDYALVEQKDYPEIDVSCTDEEAFAYFSSHYNVEKATRLMELRKKPLDDEDYGYSMFNKDEAYVGKDRHNAKWRMIMDPGEHVIARLCPEFSKYSKGMVQFWNPDSDMFYASSTTPHDLGRYIDRLYEHPYVCDNDFSSFDFSQFPGMEDLDRDLVKNKMIGLDTMDRDWLLSDKALGVVEAISKDKQLIFYMKGGWASGHPGTSIFNTNKSKHLVGWLTDGKAKCIMALGDDAGFACDECIDTEEYAKKARHLGMEATVAMRENPNLFGFCSGWGPRVGRSRKWANYLGKIFATFMFNYHNHHPKTFKRFLLGRALSAAPTTNHLPVARVMMERIIETAGGIKPLYDTKSLNPYRPQGGVVDYPTMETYEDTADRYGTTVDFLFQLEEHIATLTIDDFPLIFIHPFFAHAIEVDLEKDFEGAVNEEILIQEHDEVPIDGTYFDDVIFTPEFEEKEKLRMAGGKFWPLMKVSKKWGQDENIQYNDTGREYIHMMLSMVSYINLDWGIYWHRKMNHEAWIAEQPCFKNKKAKVLVVERKAGRAERRPPRAARLERRTERVIDRGPNPVARGMGGISLSSLWQGLQQLGKKIHTSRILFKSWTPYW